MYSESKMKIYLEKYPFMTSKFISSIRKDLGAINLMDIRITNTKNNLVAALLTCLEEKSLRELKVKDVIKVSGVSTRTFYQYYSDVNSLVNDVEDDFIAGYTESVKKDRDILDRIDLTKPVQEQLESVLNSTKNIISFCFDRKREIQILLSENGDIGFYNKIFKASCDEFMQRVGTMAGNPQLKFTEKERTLMTINVQVFVHSMIGLVEVLLNYGDILSPYDVRQSIMAFLHQSPVELMSSMVPNKEEKTEQ